MSHKKTWACINPCGDGCDGDHTTELAEARKQLADGCVLHNSEMDKLRADLDQARRELEGRKKQLHECGQSELRLDIQNHALREALAATREELAWQQIYSCKPFKNPNVEWRQSQHSALLGDGKGDGNG